MTHRITVYQDTTLEDIIETLKNQGMDGYHAALVAPQMQLAAKTSREFNLKRPNHLSQADLAELARVLDCF